MSGLARFLATGAFTGYAPLAPGTVGTLPAVALAPLLALLASRSLLAYTLALAAAIAVAVWAADCAEHDFGGKDPSHVVIDEIVGYLVAVAFLPASWPILAGGFVLFRLLDIFKPPPARWAERLPGGVGIVADDLIAGLMANLLLRLALYGGLL